MNPRMVSVLGLIAALAIPALADVKLPAVLSDNMVLQQGKKIVIWGWADPGEKVAVTLGAAKADTAADDKGNWQVAFDPLTASDKPIDLTVAGKDTIKVSNILVGEVWVCSGQSNMAFTLSSVKDAQQEIAAADFPNIRLMQVPSVIGKEPRDNLAARWVECSPKTVGRFSAVGYLFGRDLHKALKVPVGLINSSWGGSSILSWIPKEAYESDPELAKYQAWIQKDADAAPALKEKYPADLASWKATAQAIVASQPDAATKPSFPRPPVPPMNVSEKWGGMYNAMIAPLTKFNIAGAIWYQGEANASQAAEYRLWLPGMIRAWRKAFAQDFPFLYVQLPNFMAYRNDPNSRSAWAELREAQTLTLSVPKTGMAVVIDVGEAKDIHPKDKQTVGKRMALTGLAVAYGKKGIAFRGPVFDSMKADGDKMVVKFRNAEGGLVSKGENGEVAGFAIAGADGIYDWAEAKIDGDSVVLTSKGVPKPVAVRYAWSDNPTAGLYDKSDLPAGPFRAGEEHFAPTTKP